MIDAVSFLKEYKDYIIPLGVSILSAGIALGGVFISNHNQRLIMIAKMDEEFKNERERFIRDKIENFYYLFCKWESCLTSVYLRIIPCYTDGIDVNKTLNDAADNLSIAGDEAKMITTILNLYFSSLNSLYDDVYKARGDVMSFCMPKYFDRKNYKAFLDSQRTFEEQCKKFKKAIANHSEFKNR